MYNYNLVNYRLLAFISLLVAVIFCASCASRQTYLPIEASLVDTGTDRTEVAKMLGPPNAVVTQPDNTEEWYYFQDKTWFWQRIPFVGRYLGDRNVESLQIIIKDDRVVKATYYVQQLS